MPSSQDYLTFILEQLSSLPGITYRPMMGEFILYSHGKIVGGIYDDRLLVKPIPSAERYLHHLVYRLPYEGGKRMLLVEEVDDRDRLAGLFKAMNEELAGPSSPKKAKRR
jgi:TfoX/Sxy family transcriptional regulator of competence genes